MTHSNVDLQQAVTCAYEFHRNSLRNFASAAHVGDLDLGRYEGGIFFGGEMAGSLTPTSTPRQSIWAGIPCVRLSAENQFFVIPDGAEIESESEFTLEYVGVPAVSQAQSSNDPAGGEAISAIISEPAGSGVFLYHRFSLVGVGYSGIQINFGSTIRSEQGVLWRPDHPVHLVVVRENVSGVLCMSAYCNGVAVRWAGGDNTAGSNGIGSGTGQLFNQYTIAGIFRPFSGAHLAFRLWQDFVASPEDVQRMYEKAQRMFPNLMFPIPASFDLVT